MADSFASYRDGLGFPTSAREADDWAIFRTSGSRLAIFPKTKLAEDIGIPAAGTGFGGITLAHNTNSREEVDVLIERAIRSGGKLLKSPQLASWGGYSGYFADPDGYPWEIAWGEGWVFDDQGILWGGSLGNPPTARVESEVQQGRLGRSLARTSVMMPSARPRI